MYLLTYKIKLNLQTRNYFILWIIYTLNNILIMIPKCNDSLEIAFFIKHLIHIIMQTIRKG